MIEEIGDDIEIEKLKPCLICGKMTTGDVCSIEHQQEWIKRNQKPKYKPFPSSQTNTNQEIQKFNNNPATKKHGVIAMKKSTFWIIFGFTLFFALLFLINMVWSNSIYSNKDYSSSINMTNPITVNPAQTEIKNNYNNTNSYTINVDMDYDTISNLIANKVLDIINNETE